MYVSCIYIFILAIYIYIYKDTHGTFVNKYMYKKKPESLENETSMKIRKNMANVPTHAYTIQHIHNTAVVFF